MWTSFSTSPSSRRSVGIPVHCATTAAMSSSSTSSLTIGADLRLRALRELALELGEEPVADLRDAREVAVALGALGLHAQLVDLPRDLLDAVEHVLLVRPAARELVAPGLRLGELLLERLARRGRLLRHRRELDLELRHPPLGLVELDRRGVDLHPEPRRRSRRRGRSPCRAGTDPRCSGRRARPRRRAPRRGSGRRGAPRSAPSGRAGSRSCRRRTARRRSTGWKRRSSAASFSMCVRYSSSVVAPTARSSPRASIGLSRLPAETAPSAAPAPTIVWSSSMKRMISPSLAVISCEHRLEPLLELAAVLRAGDERADVERPDALALQPFGHVARDDPLREPLGDRGLPDAGLADQHRVVLRAAREHLDRAPDLLVAADHRVELPRLGERREVAAVLLERLVRALGILRRDALPAAHLLERGEERFARDDVEREQQVLDRDELVAERLRLVERLVEHAPERRRRLRLRCRRRRRRAAARAAPPPRRGAHPATRRRARRACAAAPGRAARWSGGRA